MRSTFAILLIMFSLNCFPQNSEETFSVKKKNESQSKSAEGQIPIFLDTMIMQGQNRITLNWGELKLFGKDTVSKNQLLADYNISLTVPTDKCTPTYFKMEFIVDGFGVTYSSNRPYLTHAMKKKLATLKAGDRIIMSDIGCNWINGQSIGDMTWSGIIYPFYILVTE